MRLKLGAVVAMGLTGSIASGLELYDGTYSAESFHGTFIQWGGTASITAITHQFMRAFHHDTITIHQGVFYSGQIDFSGLNGSGSVGQYGGLHVNSNGITLAGTWERFVNQRSWYTMEGGYLTTPYIGVAGGSYGGSGGTNITTAFGVAAPADAKRKSPRASRRLYASLRVATVEISASGVVEPSTVRKRGSGSPTWPKTSR